ncbi:MAG: DUF4476 domain-containing protein [Flavobacteriales bacterium]|nr:DUF4476 domain-containing protein [Flavobacteriales bacterium]
MKNILTLTLLLGSLITFAQSNLVVFSENGERFYLILNGIRQNADPQTNIKIEGLSNQFYSAKVIFADQSLGEVAKKHLMVVDADGNMGEITYAMRMNNKGEYKFKWQSFTPIQQAPPPAQNVTVIQYHSDPLPTGVQVTETTTTTTTSGTTSENVNVGMNMGGVSFGMNVNINGEPVNSTSQTTTMSTTTTTTTTGSNVIINGVPSNTGYAEPTYDAPYMEGYNGRIGCNNWIMTQNDFQSAKNSIGSKDFEDTKLRVAKQVANANCLSSNQVKQIMMLFDFENTKLDFAKMAYSRTFDVDNYYKVHDAFDFESSISDLNRSIGVSSGDGW